MGLDPFFPGWKLDCQVSPGWEDLSEAMAGGAVAVRPIGGLLCVLGLR